MRVFFKGGKKSTRNIRNHDLVYKTGSKGGLDKWPLVVYADAAERVLHNLRIPNFGFKSRISSEIMVRGPQRPAELELHLI